MIKQNKKTLVITSLLILLPIIFGLVMWNELPEKVPTHWGVNGNPDGWSSKGFAVFGLPLIVFVLHWLAVLATEKDNKNKGQNPKVMTLVLWICPLLCVTLSTVTYSYALGNQVNVKTVVLLILGVLFAAIGNYLPKCKKNHTIGIRIKSTLSSEENWNITHRFAGRIWFAGGIAIMVCAFLPNTAAAVVMLVTVLVMLIAPWVYSVKYKTK